MFNLAWVMAGGPAPLSDYRQHAGSTLWVLEQSPGLIRKGVSAPDAALAMSLQQFKAWLPFARRSREDPMLALLRLSVSVVAAARVEGA